MRRGIPHNHLTTTLPARVSQLLSQAASVAVGQLTCATPPPAARWQGRTRRRNGRAYQLHQREGGREDREASRGTRITPDSGDHPDTRVMQPRHEWH